MGYVYPDSPVPSEGYSSSDEFATVIAGPYMSGRSVVGKGREYSLFRARLAYARMALADFQPVYTLFSNVRGRFGTFTFFDFTGHDASPVGAAWVRLYVGIGSGATTGFDLPMKSATNRTVYVNGSVTSAYTFYSGTGVDGRDRIGFAVAPPSGHIIELSATGRRAVTARFAEDTLQIARYAAGLVDASIEIVEAR